VQIGSGPAAVTGDKIHDMSLSAISGWEDAEIRVIRESEDLPSLVFYFCGASGIKQ